MFKLAPADLGG